MNPATPVTTQTLGAERNCSRRWRYGAEITSSQWREYPPSRFRAVVRGSTTARSNAPPTAAIHVRRQGIFHSHRAQGSQQYLSSISRVSTGAYERGGTLLCAGLHFFVAALPHSCGGRTTTHTHVSQQRFLGEVGPLHPSQCHDWKPGPIKRLQAGLVKPWSDALPSQAWLWR